LSAPHLTTTCISRAYLQDISPKTASSLNMVNPMKPPANGFVSGMRRVYNPLGFAKGYNFVFWFITMGSA
jgi:hypothetical protein